MSSLQPGILIKTLMYTLQHKHLGRGKGSQLNSSSKKQQQLKVMDQKVSRSVIKQNLSSPFRPNADHSGIKKYFRPIKINFQILFGRQRGY